MCDPPNILLKNQDEKIVTAFLSFHFTLISFQFLVNYFHFTNFVFKIRFYDLLPAEFGIQLMTRQPSVLIICKININNFEYYNYFCFLNVILRSSCVSSIIPYFVMQIFFLSATYEKLWKFLSIVSFTYKAVRELGNFYLGLIFTKPRQKTQ
jgi:hypothetical protein